MQRCIAKALSRLQANTYVRIARKRAYTEYVQVGVIKHPLAEPLRWNFSGAKINSEQLDRMQRCLPGTIN